MQTVKTITETDVMDEIIYSIYFIPVSSATLFWPWTMAFLKAKPSRDTAAALKQSQETSSEFEERFSALASSAYTLLGVALGGRLGLFHKMAAMEEPWTPRELAEAGDWKERWVWGLAKG